MKKKPTNDSGASISATRKANVEVVSRASTKSRARSKIGPVDLVALGQLFRTKRAEAQYDLATLATRAMVSIEVINQLEVAPEKVPLMDLYAVANTLNLDPGTVLELLHNATRSSIAKK